MTIDKNSPGRLASRTIVEKEPVFRNPPPVLVEILRPKDQREVTLGQTIRLHTSASEGSVDLSSEVNWRSSIDGFLGRGQNVPAQLSLGEHTLTASVRRPVSTARAATSGTNEPTVVKDVVSVCVSASDPITY